MKAIKTIGVLCSGGDCPGMNAAIRSVVRTALVNDINVFGIQNGYSGLLEEKFKSMNTSDVGNIIQRGGTILQTSRCLDFHKQEIREKAYEVLKKFHIDALVVIGGNGSFSGAHCLSKEHKFPVAGIPATIDNDISGTDFTLGFFTAVETGIRAVDNIRDTASSHNRNFIIEVMGRKSPAIAIHVGICTGAESVILSQNKINFDELASGITHGEKRGKKSSIIIVAESDSENSTYEIQKTLQSNFNISSHVCILGHIQRGGTPIAFDRFLASKMGYIVVTNLLKEKKSIVSVVRNGSVTYTSLEECVGTELKSDSTNLDMIKVLSL